MSLNLLRITLGQLSSQSFSPPERARTLQNVFTLFERLVNEKNVVILVRALFLSSIWSGTEAFVVAYAFTDATRYLSDDRATELRIAILKCVRDAKETPVWRKAIFLSVFIAAEMRDHKGVPAWYSSKGKFVSAYIAAVNAAMTDVTCDINIKAALLISMSSVFRTLSAYQHTKIEDDTLVGLIDGLYMSRLAFGNQNGSKVSMGERGSRELGLMTKTILDIIDYTSLTSSISAISTLEGFSRARRQSFIDGPEAISRPVFLSLVTIAQSLLINSARQSLDSRSRNELAIQALQLLRNLQGFHEDNSVFESWRFCFNISLDMLADGEHGLSDYFTTLLESSPMSQFPLSSALCVGLYSKRKDEDDVQWLLLVIEAAALAVQSRSTLTRLFDFCYDQLTRSDSRAENTELLHSVILSLLVSHKDIFRARMRGFAKYVLDHDEDISDRQFKLIFKTLYPLSIPTEVQGSTEDPQDILGLLKRGIALAVEGQKRTKLVSCLIGLLPDIPAPFLLHNLGQVEPLLFSEPNDLELDSHFIETCTTEMDSERAIICVRYLMSRKRNLSHLQEKARL